MVRIYYSKIFLIRVLTQFYRQNLDW